MFDSKGVWQKQRVHFGRTKRLSTGAYACGLFTGSYLAWHIAEPLFLELQADPKKPKQYVENLGFVLEN